MASRKQMILDLLNQATKVANNQYNAGVTQANQAAANSAKTMQQAVNDQMIARGLSRSTLPVTIGTDNQATIEAQKNADITNLGIARDSNLLSAKDKYYSQLMSLMGGGGGSARSTSYTDPITGTKYPSYAAMLQDRLNVQNRNAQAVGQPDAASLDAALDYAKKLPYVKGSTQPQIVNGKPVFN